jgi:hypothetical protein
VFGEKLDRFHLACEVLHSSAHMEIEPPLKRISFGKQRYVEFLTNSIQGQDKTPKGNETNEFKKQGCCHHTNALVATL